MSRLVVVALALLVLVMPASAEKVAYLLEETGQVNVDLFIDLPAAPDYHETFQYNGPFYPALPFTEWRSPSYGADNNTWVRAWVSLEGELQRSFTALAEWNPNGESQLPNSASVTWILEWRFLIADEPMQVRLVGGDNDTLTDATTGQVWQAGPDVDPALVNLTPHSEYRWHMDLQTTPSHSFTVNSRLAFVDGQLIPVPEPKGLFLLAGVLIGIILRKSQMRSTLGDVGASACGVSGTPSQGGQPDRG